MFFVTLNKSEKDYSPSTVYQDYSINEERGSFSSPFACLRFANFQSHYGSASISIVWKMKEPLPGVVMRKTVKI
ncbi:MAG: hypothetical protein P4L69_21535 [Desulfosporosinus sp.]|nr:hypothetical protein [Desulfosporosinus sp.]